MERWKVCAVVEGRCGVEWMSDISTPEGMQLAEEKKLVTTLCPKSVQDAAEIIELIWV